jgi:hypothetical protein
MVGADGQPQWPYDTRPWQGDSPYSRGERGEDAGGGPLWSPVRSTPISLFERYWPLWSPVRCLHPSPSLKGSVWSPGLALRHGSYCG